MGRAYAWTMARLRWCAAKSAMGIALFMVALNCAKAEGQTQPPGANAPPPSRPPETRFTDELMKSTFFLVGTDGHRSSFGTGFVLLRPFANDAKHGQAFLITAAHVFEGMPADVISLASHARTSTGWAAAPLSLRIREGADHHAVWTRHPTEDVAAVRVAIDMALSTQVLFEAGSFGGDGLNSGDELRILGFPLGLDLQPPGFPLLRTGRVASYLEGTGGRVDRRLFCWISLSFPGTAEGRSSSTRQREASVAGLLWGASTESSGWSTRRRSEPSRRPVHTASARSHGRLGSRWSSGPP